MIKTAISHPKKQRLKTKDDKDSTPSSPFKPFPLSQSSSLNPSYPSAIPSQLNAAIAPFSRNNSTNSTTITPYRVGSVSGLEDKNKFEEVNLQ